MNTNEKITRRWRLWLQQDVSVNSSERYSDEHELIKIKIGGGDYGSNRMFQ
jgi:hypothetical protein